MNLFTESVKLDDQISIFHEISHFIYIDEDEAIKCQRRLIRYYVENGLDRFLNLLEYLQFPDDIINQTAKILI
jgi:hypothetical protein